MLRFVEQAPHQLLLWRRQLLRRVLGAPQGHVWDQGIGP
jgi:hypothetical protein